MSKEFPAAPVSGQGTSIGEDTGFKEALARMVNHYSFESRSALIAYIDSRPRSKDSRACKDCKGVPVSGVDENGRCHECRTVASERSGKPADDGGLSVIEEKWCIYYDNLGENPYTSNFMHPWMFFDSKDEAQGYIDRPMSSMPLKHYTPRKVMICATAEHSSAAPSDDAHAFKNFHSNLCKRFGYVHDERDWRRDQVSLIEHIDANHKAHAELRANFAAPSPTGESLSAAMEWSIEWIRNHYQDYTNLAGLFDAMRAAAAGASK